MISIEKLENNHVKILVEGIIESSMRKTIAHQLEEVVDEGYLFFLIDMSDVEYIDSTGIGIFVTLRTKLIKRNGKINIINLPSQVERLFRVTRLYDILCNQELGEAGGIK